MPTSTSAATPPSPKTALQRDVEASAADAKTVAELRDKIYQLETALHQANSAAAAASAAPHAQSAQSVTTIIQEGQRVESELSRAQQAAAESLAAAKEKKARKKHVKNTTFSQQNPYNTPTKTRQKHDKNTTKLTARNRHGEIFFFSFFSPAGSGHFP